MPYIAYISRIWGMADSRDTPSVMRTDAAVNVHIHSMQDCLELNANVTKHALMPLHMLAQGSTSILYSLET